MFADTVKEKKKNKESNILLNNKDKTEALIFIISDKMSEELFNDALTKIWIENVSHNEIRRYL